MDNNDLRNDMFKQFYKFVDHEYSLLLLSKRRYKNDSDILD
jgi:hypothetical protein